MGSRMDINSVTDPRLEIKTNVLPAFIVFVSMIVILSFVYSSVYQREYLIIDDYFFLNHIRMEPTDIVDEVSVQQGRFLCAILTTRAVYRVLDWIGSGQTIRFLNIVLLAGVGTFFYGHLRLLGLDAASSYSISLTICTLLPFQIIPFWVCMFGSTVGMLLSLAGSTLFFSRLLKDQHCSKGRVFGTICVVSLCFLLSLWLYESFAMCYWTLPALVVLIGPTISGSWRRTRTLLLLYTMTGFIVLGIQFCLLKLVPIVLDLSLHERTTMVSSVEDIVNRLHWFTSECLVRGVCFWTYMSIPLALGVSLVIGTAVLLRIFRKCQNMELKSSPSIWILLERGVWVIGFICLSFGPSLMVRESLTRYRTFAPFVPILFVILVLSLRELLYLVKSTNNLKRDLIWRACLLAILLGSSLIASNRVSEIVWNNCLDRQVLLSRLRQIPNDNYAIVKTIYVIPFNDQFSNRYNKLEFAYLSSSVPWAVESMTRVLLSHQGIDARSIEIETNGRPQHKTRDSSAVEVDMRTLRGYFDVDSGFINHE